MDWWDPWAPPSEADEPDFEIPAIEVEITENPVVGTLLGPDGSVLIEFRERPPLGFAPPIREE